MGRNSKHLSKVKEIYDCSFPESERLEFSELVNSRFPNSKIWGIFCKRALIGFSFVSVYKEFAYIVYFAIEEKLRNKHLGSFAIKLICELFGDKTKVLCVEKPQSKEDLRSRRINFYKRNGFSLADFEFECSGDTYFTMFSGEYDKSSFLSFLTICFPDCSNFKSIKWK